MRKWFRILLVMLLLAVAGGIAWLAFRSPAEPVYNGKALSVWLQNFNSDVVDGREAEDAVRHIGTNAIPTLLSMLRAKDSGLKIRFIRLLARQNWIKIKVTLAADRNYAACSAFEVLGADAKSAVPELIQIYGQDISTESKCLTADALGYIGPLATNAIPALLRGLKTTNDPVRWNTVWALRKIHSQPELVVPELIKLLHDPNYRVRMIAKDALSNFGTNARMAIPVLIEMLDDQNSNNRELATNALKEIDPEAPAKTGVK
jgi:hypothetical protein